MTVYVQPGQEGSKVQFKDRYENWIGGEWVAPTTGQYIENVSPVNGKQFTEVARGAAADVELALDAAHKAAPAWGKASATERAAVLNRIADRIDANLEMLAVAESWDNGKPIRETLNADIPLAADHFRYFASAIRAQEGRLSQLDDDTTAYHFHEPLGVVGQIIPWNFPILMAVWKMAPALAAGNAVVLKPASNTPASILVLAELIADLLPAGLLNIVNGFGCRGRQAAGLQPADPQDRLHRRDLHRTPDQPVRQPEPDPGHAGARRQEPEHLLQRCCRRPTTRSTTRRWRASPSMPSTRAKSAAARPAPWSRTAFTIPSWLTPWPGRRRSSRATRWTPTPRSAPRHRWARWRRSSPTSTSGSKRAPRSWPAGTDGA